MIRSAYGVQSESFWGGRRMERVKLYCRGACRGEITLAPDGARTEIRAAMEDPGDGLYRAVLVGQEGELLLGVMEPAGKGLQLCRRPYHRDVRHVGELLRGEARCSFLFGDTACWHETGDPAQLFRGAFLQSRLRAVGRAWWRREGGLLLLAIPLEQGRGFPLESLFCLARIERVKGSRCVVYAFDEQEKPVLR